MKENDARLSKSKKDQPLSIDVAPASIDESEDFKKFLDLVMPLSLVILVVGSYAPAALYPAALYESADTFLRIFPFSRARFEMLGLYGAASQVSYVSSFLAGVFLWPFLLLVQLAGYWKTVVFPRKCKRVGMITRASMLTLLGLILVPLWFAFIFSSLPVDPRMPGLMRIFFWPLFPTFSALLVFTSVQGAFALTIWIAKLFFFKADRFQK